MPPIAMCCAVLISAAAPELKIAAPGLTLNGLDEKLSSPFTDHLAQRFEGVRVITSRDIAALLGLQRQAQLLACGDAAANCMAELGNALGVDGVLIGDVVKLGRVVQLNLRIIDP
ncbi:MAG: hypothetical protein JNK82_08910 [Myxococcaceae bacterium]|nr:hypothetical protein [Myxococcaceae bacterium]